MGGIGGFSAIWGLGSAMVGMTVGLQRLTILLLIIVLSNFVIARLAWWWEKRFDK